MNNGSLIDDGSPGTCTKRLLPPRMDIKCQSLFSSSSCYFLYLGQVKGGSYLFILTQIWSLNHCWNVRYQERSKKSGKCVFWDRYERWCISSDGPTLYKGDGLERLIFSCSHCFFFFFICCQENMLMLKYNHQKTKTHAAESFVSLLFWNWFVFFEWKIKTQNKKTKTHPICLYTVPQMLTKQKEDYSCHRILKTL